MRRIMALTGVSAAVVALVAIAVGATGASAQSNTIKIGSLITQTGAFADSDAPAALGLKAWVDATNKKGGINGKKISLTIKDDKSTPSVALGLVKQFAADKNTVAVVGNVSSVIGSWATAASKAKLPVVGEFPFTPSSTTNKYVFPQATTYQSVLYGEVYSAIKLAGAKKIAFLYCAENAGCALSADVVKKHAAALGGESVNSQAVPFTAPNYDAVCTAAKNSGAEALVLALGASTIISVANSCASVGYKPKYVVQTTALLPSMGKVPALNGRTYGVVGTFLWTASKTSAQKAAQAAFKAAKVPASKYGAGLALGYTAGALFGEAVKSIKGNVTRESVAAAVGKLKNVTLGGLSVPLTYKGLGPSPEQKSFYVGRLTGGKWVAVGGSDKTYKQP